MALFPKPQKPNQQNSERRNQQPTTKLVSSSGQPTTSRPIAAPVKRLNELLPEHKRTPVNRQQLVKVAIAQIKKAEENETQSAVDALVAEVQSGVQPVASLGSLGFLKRPPVKPVDGSTDVGIIVSGPEHLNQQLDLWASEAPVTGQYPTRLQRYEANYNSHSIVATIDGGRCKVCGLDGTNNLQQFGCDEHRDNMVKACFKKPVPVPNTGVQVKPAVQLKRAVQGMLGGKPASQPVQRVQPIVNKLYEPTIKISKKDLVSDSFPVEVSPPVQEKFNDHIQHMSVYGVPVVQDGQPVRKQYPVGCSGFEGGSVMTAPQVKQAAMSAMLRPTRSASGEKLGQHIVINAGAGTGKTTTVVEGINRMMGKTGIKFKASEEQELIWNVMSEGIPPQSILLMAFNTSITKELAERVPRDGIAAVQGIHSYGYQSLLKSGVVRGKANKLKTKFMIEDVCGAEIYDKCKGIGYPFERVVGLIKTSLIDWRFQVESAESVYTRLCSRYGITRKDDWDDVIIDSLPAVMKASFEKTHIFDFDDMIWLPNVRDEVRIDRRDVVIVDEAQDMNPAQQGLIKKVGRRFVVCGDRYQAIYGFTGSDTRSIDSFVDYLEGTSEGCRQLPLTITRRCPLAGVRLANKVNSSLQAAPGAIEGSVIYNREEDGMDHVGPEDMVICRMNAPLVIACLRMLKAGKKAHIQGKDIGANLIKLINSFKTDDVAELQDEMQIYREREAEKISKRKYGSDMALTVLDDTLDTITAFCSGMQNVGQVCARIDRLFDDKNTEGTLFSSIHKAKGLERKTVVFLQHDMCPHPMAKQEWERDQEWNLWYVAVTRFKETLYMTKSKQKKSSELSEEMF